jgi:hypothetical protein
VEALQDAALSAPLPDVTFNWNPSAEGDYALDARAQVFGEFWAEWGPIQPVTAIIDSLPPVLRFLGPPAMGAGQIEIEFEVENFRTGLSFELLRAPGVDTDWTVDNNATFEIVTPDSRFRVRTLLDDADDSGYFRVRSN